MGKAEQAAKERRVFLEFLNLNSWPNDVLLFESRNPPEPDILYNHPTEGEIAFELTELCAEEIASALPYVGSEARFIRASSPVESIISQKIGKHYKTEHPKELLCYTAGRTVEPDDMILAEIRHAVKESSCQFRKIWLLGDSLHLVHSI